MIAAIEKPGAGLPAYPEMRPSGVEWLGDIPKHWHVRRVKHVAEIIFSSADKHVNDGELPVLLCNYLDVYRNGTITEEFEFMPATATASEIRRLTLQDGDVIITKDSESWTDIAKPAYVRGHLQSVICGYHLALLRPRAAIVDGRFLYWSLSARGVNDQFRVCATGITRFGLGKDGLNCGLIPLPPLPEQRAIAAFLDRETAEIDRLIGLKERLLELLEERRAALISHAVTRGLDPSAPTKPSGVTWLGEIPAHWTTRRLKFAAKLETGHTPRRSESSYWESCTIPWVTLNDVGFMIEHDRIYEPENYISEEGLAGSSARVLPADTVVLSRDATVGRAIILGQPMATSQHFVDWICCPELLPEYLLFVLRGPMQAEFARLMMGSTIATIGMPEVNTFRVSLPPVREQREIVACVLRERAAIDRLAEKIRVHVARLRERRAALITAAVTGKIDVRGMAEAGEPC